MIPGGQGGTLGSQGELGAAAMEEASAPGGSEGRSLPLIPGFVPPFGLLRPGARESQEEGRTGIVVAREW